MSPFSSLLQENSLHTPSLKFRPESSNWSNYPNYFKLLLQLQKFYFLPQVTSQCTNPNFLKFFHIPSCSFPEAPQDTFKGRSSLQASFEPIPGITRHVWLCQQVLMREYKHIDCSEVLRFSCGRQSSADSMHHFLMMSLQTMPCPQEQDYFLDDQNTTTDPELSTDSLMSIQAINPFQHLS